jgi:hypothetical protein
MRDVGRLVAAAVLAVVAGTCLVPVAGWAADRPAPEFGPAEVRPLRRGATPMAGVLLDDRPGGVVDAAGAAGPPGTATASALGATYEARLELAVPARPVPVRVRVASVGIDAPVVAGGAAGGELAVPPNAVEVGWYRPGPVPGADGSAVLAAHVDHGGRLGAFVGLEGVGPGDLVVVDLDDGTSPTFLVSALHRYGRDQLPTAELFATGGPSSLALVTCGGEFDAATRHYTENVVVTAVPVGARPGP